MVQSIKCLNPGNSKTTSIHTANSDKFFLEYMLLIQEWYCYKWDARVYYPTFLLSDNKTPR